MIRKSFLAFAIGLVLPMPVYTGCASLAAQKQEAEAAYLGEQLTCVDQAKTRAEADACRQRVRDEWARADAATSADGAR